MNQRTPDDEDYDARARTNMIVLAVVAVIVFVGWLVVDEMQKETALEDCYAASHRNCEPVDQPDSH